MKNSYGVKTDKNSYRWVTGDKVSYRCVKTDRESYRWVKTAKVSYKWVIKNDESRVIKYRIDESC